MRAALALAALAAGWVAAIPANATWSIVAVDPETREVGVAGASCIGGVDVIGGLVPGRGVVAAQASANVAGRDLATQRLAAGVSPADILAEITDPAWDPERWFDPVGGFTRRQYAVAVLEPSPDQATFTGASTFEWAGTREGEGVAAAGNLLVGPEVVEQALLGYGAPRGDCTPRLAERLLSALEAGGVAGGDRRCSPELAALTAYLEVAAPADPPGESSLRLVIPLEDETEGRFWVQLWRFYSPKQGGPNENPVRKLRSRYLDAVGGKACLLDPAFGAYQTVP